MTPQAYPSPLPGGETTGEFVLTFDSARPPRLLIVPALFDEANRLLARPYRAPWVHPDAASV